MEANGGSPLALSGSASSGGAKQEPLLVDAWIVQKLKNDWSSSDFGSLLSREKLSEAVAGFRLLDTAVKVGCCTMRACCVAMYTTVWD